MSLATASTAFDTLQTGLSSYAIYLSYIAIKNIRTWEGPTKTAARHSDAANTQLLKSRTTLASGAVSTAFSLLSAAGPNVLPVSDRARVILTIVNIMALTGARTHIANFWGLGNKVPGAGAYNEGAKTTVKLRLWMRYLIAVAVLELGVRGVMVARG
ncbi:MAG: hypothetical protein M1828_001101 [Chrysothrix sp. TS-e1954]|nr:MAG: hypothetical protein M1828_001101 [Chrysothrix sp. TS-e1954]